MKKLVVIDDEDDFCTLVKLQCLRNGVECRYANTIAEGISLLNDFVPDVVILDNNLPDGYGWQHADYLLGKYPHISLNLITAKNSFEKSNNTYYKKDERISCYLKPLSLLQLDNIIHTTTG
ncbi:response regulator [Parasediminibacterium sp. JCM 36343]|uniref:response regulator n=1 Tax=Parasediminibacterium sp. JCM 36343 TaxID=3374279 RepID=UPI0039781D75